MKLEVFLEESGWSKAAIARELGISPPAVALWDEIPDKHMKVLAGILITEEEAPPVVRKCHPKDLPDDELKLIIRSRSGTTDWDICKEHGWRIHEFNKAIADWVKRNPYKKPENGYDLSKYVKGGIVDKETGEFK